MKVDIVAYAGTSEEDDGIATLLGRVYVDGGYTDAALGSKMFAPSEVRRRGAILLAKSAIGSVVGMIVCGAHANPYRQVAERDEAEMQLLAVDRPARGIGLGRALCLGFEAMARSSGFGKAVLSTQSTMVDAHRLYDSLGYRRNPARDWVRADRTFMVLERRLDILAPTPS